jgi:hypothetical protein
MITPAGSFFHTFYCLVIEFFPSNKIMLAQHLETATYIRYAVTRQDIEHEYDKRKVP